MRIAVIGAGVSGLVCAHLLSERHDIALFEASDYPGGHVNTVRVDTENETHRVDTGFIVLNDRTYPNFERLLARLGVATQRSDMSFSVSDGAHFEYNGASANGLFACRANIARPSFHRMVRDLLRFNRDAVSLIGLNERGPSLGEFLDRGGYSLEFVKRLIVPQVSAVWSADPASLWEFPASMLAEFFANHGMFGLNGRPNWLTVRGGSDTYVNAIVKQLGKRVRLSTPIARVERQDDGVEVTPADAESERFDEVIIAAHSNQALRMLADPSPSEAEVLGAIPYQLNEAVLHTDRSLLPKRRRAWASWNFHLRDEPLGRTTVTYHMNRLQSLRSEQEFCVTLNQTDAIDPGAVVKVIRYEHPVYTPAGLAAQRRWQEISGVRHTHYCGAYWGYGFHEDGVASALRVCSSFGATLT